MARIKIATIALFIVPGCYNEECDQKQVKKDAVREQKSELYRNTVAHVEIYVEKLFVCRLVKHSCSFKKSVHEIYI
jgi:hypothetical protein